MANTQMTDEAKTMTRDAAQTLIEFANRMTNITGNTALWTAPGAMFAHKRPWDYPESVSNCFDNEMAKVHIVDDRAT